MSRTNPRNTVRNLNVKNGFLLDGVAVTPTAAELNELAGAGLGAAELSKINGIAAAGYLTVAEEFTFTETTGAGIYTATCTKPAGATLLDIIVNGVALWNTTTSATLIVGDAVDPDGYYTAVDLKATDLLAGESISFAMAGGKAGAYIANSQVSPRYTVAAQTVIGVVTSVGAAGTLGRTRMLVVYAMPTIAVAATKV